MKSSIFLIFLVSSMMFNFGCLIEKEPLNSWLLNKDVLSASMEKSGKYLAVLTKDDVCLINVSKENIEKTFKIENKNYFKILCDNDTCWIGGGSHKNGTFSILSIKKNSFKKVNLTNYSDIYDICLSNKNDTLATAHGNGEIIIWDAISGYEQRKFGDYDTEILALRISHDGNRLYSGNGLGRLDIWSLDSGKKIKSKSKVIDGIFTISEDVEKNTIICGGSDGILCILDNEALSVRKKIVLGEDAILSCDIRKKDSKIVCGMTNGYIAIVNHDGSSKKNYKLHKGDVLYIKFINNGKNIISVSEDGTIKIWDLNVLIEK